MLVARAYRRTEALLLDHRDKLKAVGLNFAQEGSRGREETPGSGLGAVVEAPLQQWEQGASPTAEPASRGSCQTEEAVPCSFKKGLSLRNL